jgi:folylpolyglutamate synthase/dihydropteroate synthase
MHRHDAAQAIVISDPALALQRALDDVGASDIICVAGSLHLAAGAVRQLTPQPKS